MSLLLCSLMSAWVTYINLGWNPDFFNQWGMAFIKAWPIAGLVAFVSAPEILKFSHWLVNRPDKNRH